MKTLKKIVEALPQPNQPTPGGMSPGNTGTSQDILVPGVGKYDYNTLKQNTIRKLDDLVKRANSDRFETIGSDQMEVLSLFWKALSDHKKRGGTST